VPQKRLVSRRVMAPGNREQGNDVMTLGVLTMIITVFLSLMGQGYPPREALAITIALGFGGAEVIRRLPRGRDDDSRGRR
jgi:hypothetical protein